MNWTGDRGRASGREASERASEEIVFVTCERAGEAKLRGRVKEVLLNAGGADGMKSSGVGCVFCMFAAMCIFFVFHTDGVFSVCFQFQYFCF